MLTHAQIWRAVDRLAERHGLTASALAKRAGLDATTFNRSKREAPDGRPRWPSTESIAKILVATGASLDDFMELVQSPRGGPSHPASVGRSLPLIGFSRAGDGAFFDAAGLPVGSGWEEAIFPDIDDAHAYALEIAGDAMMPLYRDGDIVVVSPAAAVRRGDRVIVRTRRGEVLAREMKRRTARTLELRPLSPGLPDQIIPEADIAWVARVLWASQ
ncbi:helix-turn-helix transcriptional regulator [Ancylobacter sp. Lp-2]|uniref:S24 family peptidase n=1 Tax=Ancylobacter sp. Lp-2 TaxID=2881339 RepID=UPI001E36F176|nr:helix-turn-helix transcriptional regulator [Ancylobacter sp. Lp-2]MCB4770639.1 helix-turn-helix transcriptional regulator [Ancylobacter sp. Lp-2]